MSILFYSESYGSDSIGCSTGGKVIKPIRNYWSSSTMCQSSTC